jgi:hypothetical protein
MRLRLTAAGSKGKKKQRPVLPCISAAGSIDGEIIGNGDGGHMDGEEKGRQATNL